MPAAVRIKAGKYGSAIGLLLEQGGAFQTRHQRTLIVDAAQKRALEQAGLVEARKKTLAENFANGSAPQHSRRYAYP
ncbi:MAG: hypothetical protein E6K70_24085 [Planctomycetota bacterium]|nr:MAG: hypothetical protein E6K70_24085 [Planctomycetota bacterium]